MSWITPLTTPPLDTTAGNVTPLDAVLGHRPELRQRYHAFYDTLCNDARVPRRTLELCRLRVAAIHDCAQEWQTRDAAVALTDDQLRALRQGVFSAFTPAEQCALVIAEQMPYAHHNVTDAEVEQARVALGSAGAVALLTAIAFFDVACRLQLTLGIDAGSDPSLTGASLTGASMIGASLTGASLSGASMAAPSTPANA